MGDQMALQERDPFQQQQRATSRKFPGHMHAGKAPPHKTKAARRVIWLPVHVSLVKMIQSSWLQTVFRGGKLLF
jgi:hypothetical protein